MPRENCLYFRLQLNIEIHGYLAMLELPVGLPINYNLIFRKEREKGKKERKNQDEEQPGKLFYWKCIELIAF